MNRGHYRRAEDSKWIRRYRCVGCRRSFSSSRLTSCFGQKKRRKNIALYRLLVNGVSQRAAARLLKINRKTVARKLVFLGVEAKTRRLKRLQELSGAQEKLGQLQFDELETFERSKCLPLSVPLAVVPKTREILSFRVASMPAKGPLAHFSRQKYGFRKDDRRAMALELFAEIAPALTANVRIKSDENPKYPSWIKSRLPRATHETIKGARGCVVGQGELKRLAFDPLFSLNHTCAMLRANINRLFRRTWCTTKRPDRLAAHIEIYVMDHNVRVRA